MYTNSKKTLDKNPPCTMHLWDPARNSAQLLVLPTEVFGILLPFEAFLVQLAQLGAGTRMGFGYGNMYGICRFS